MVKVCLSGVWHNANWDASKVGVWFAGAWYNLAAFDAYVIEYN